ncbi:MAG: hypothetical protein Q8O52_00225 [Sulfuritalea sp.]|nr:hypothetical protein [Sulfuritalea sp.]
MALAVPEQRLAGRDNGPQSTLAQVGATVVFLGVKVGTVNKSSSASTRRAAASWCR